MATLVEIFVPALTALLGVALGGGISGRQARKHLELELREQRQRLVLELQYDKVLEFVKMTTKLAYWPAALNHKAAANAIVSLGEDLVQWQGAKSYVYSMDVSRQLNKFLEALLKVVEEIEEAVSKDEAAYEKVKSSWPDEIRGPYRSLVNAILEELHTMA